MYIKSFYSGGRGTQEPIFLRDHLQKLLGFHSIPRIRHRAINSVLVRRYCQEKSAFPQLIDQAIIFQYAERIPGMDLFSLHSD